MRTHIWISNPIKRQVSIKSEGICHHCGLRATSVIVDQWNILKFRDKDGIPFELDHLIPLHSGGKTTLKNIVLSCRTCNRSKVRLDPEYMKKMKSLVKKFK